jgi:benzaldehyde dehydrogenase (NAD)
VLKPDVQTPVGGGFIIARLFEEAGLPPGVLHVLPGGAETGEAMCVAPRIAMIAFTGSTRAGRRVGALAGDMNLGSMHNSMGNEAKANEYLLKAKNYQQ